MTPFGQSKPPIYLGRARRESLHAQAPHRAGDGLASGHRVNLLERYDYPAAASPRTPHEQIFAEFGDYLRSDCGLSAKTIVHHLPAIRRFLFEVCPGGTSDLGEITQEQVIRYIERHAQDWSPSSAKAMCWSLRAFLKYLHHTGLNPRALGGCVPSIRRWKLASLPTYLAPAQVQKVLDGCDRACVTGRRDYAILMLLSRLGLRADEVEIGRAHV